MVVKEKSLSKKKKAPRALRVMPLVVKESDYFPARIFGPLKGQPNSGAKTQKSNRPASNGTAPITTTTMPVVPVSPSKPHAIKAMPATMRTMRPVAEAMKVQKGFIFLYLLW
jgi:hypothetical protein